MNHTSSPVNKPDTNNVSWELNLQTSEGFSISSESSAILLGPKISLLTNDNTINHQGCYQYQDLCHCIVYCSLLSTSVPDSIILAELLQNKDGPCNSTWL